MNREEIIKALISLGCDREWCEQFKTEDLDRVLRDYFSKDIK